MRKKDSAAKMMEIALAKDSATHGCPVEYRARLLWKDGMPMLVDAVSNLSEQPDTSLRSLLKKCLDLPYDGKDPSLQGLSQGEAMIVNLTRDAANGLPSARSEVIDRLLGKATQPSTNISMTGDINDFLDKVAEQTRTITIRPKAQEAEIVSETEDL